jgi:membrane associated rhomboid family serine protease
MDVSKRRQHDDMPAVLAGSDCPTPSLLQPTAGETRLTSEQVSHDTSWCGGGGSQCAKYGRICLRWFPTFTLSMTLLIWVMFLWGAYSLIGRSTRLTSTSPVSPPLPTFPFRSVAWWPSCADLRGEGWRFFSFQLVHQGLQHVGGNTIGILFYCGFLELTWPWYPTLTTMLVFELGCILGALGHNYVWPYDSLVGCSPGLYCAMGCCIGTVVINGSGMHKFAKLLLIAVTSVTLVVETIIYFRWFDPHVSYYSHCTALFAGLFLSFSLAVTKPSIPMKLLGAFSICAFLVLAISLVVHYAISFPPKMLPYNPTFHPYYERSCCEAVYSKVNTTYPLEQAMQNYVCDGDEIIYSPQRNYR